VAVVIVVVAVVVAVVTTFLSLVMIDTCAGNALKKKVLRTQR
jgi:uncharacterized membrane protein (DUF106 family)